MNFLVFYFIFINLNSFAVFGTDKRKAIKHQRRIPENVLLILAFLGGAVGAVLGMLVFRHKISKTSFIIKLTAVIILQGFFYIYFINNQ